MSDTQRDAILRAVVSLGHTITDGSVTLYYDPKIPGNNALDQLVSLVATAVAPSENKSGGGTFADGIAAAVALCKQHAADWDEQTRSATRTAAGKGIAQSCFAEASNLASEIGRLPVPCNERLHGTAEYWKAQFDIVNAQDHDAIAADRVVQHALGFSVAVEAAGRLIRQNAVLGADMPTLAAQVEALRPQDYSRDGMEIPEVHRGITSEALGKGADALTIIALGDAAQAVVREHWNNDAVRNSESFQALRKLVANRAPSDLVAPPPTRSGGA